MDRVKEEFATRRRALVVLALYAIAVGAVSFVVNIGDAFSGEGPAMGRALLGLLGVTAGVWAWTFRSTPVSGWHLLMAWSLIQIPVFAWNPAGSPTTQIISLPFGITSSQEVNGVLTSYSQIGINLVGVILAVVVSRQRIAFTGKRAVLPASAA